MSYDRQNFDRLSRERQTGMYVSAPAMILITTSYNLYYVKFYKVRALPFSRWSVLHAVSQLSARAY